MLIGINNLNQIKQIREITDVNLTVIELDETSENYPFKNWSETKILCYCYKKTEQGTSIYPYIQPAIMEKIEAENSKLLQHRADIDYLSIMTGVDL